MTNGKGPERAPTLSRTLYTHLRGVRKQRRKRYRSYHRRGRLATGRWTPCLAGGGPCLLSLVERKTGYVVLVTLRARTTAEVNRRATPLIRPARARPDDYGGATQHPAP